MKAVVFTEYGSPEVLKIRDVKKPTPGENQILIKIRATAVNSGDLRLRKADPFAVRFMLGLFKPKIQILGSVYSGEVEATGNKVSNFKKGDLVFGHTDMKFGAYAEYISVSDKSTISFKPENLSHEEAASVPFGGLTALYWIRKLELQAGSKVLIYGASGAVGSAAVQLAKAEGAIVTAVCSSGNHKLVKSLGADFTIDYKSNELESINGKFDVVIETVNKTKVTDVFNLLKTGGTLVLSAAMLKQMIKGKTLSGKNGKTIHMGLIAHDSVRLEYIKNLCEKGLYKPVIDTIYPLEEISKAHEYADKGHKKGNVVITVQN